MIAPLLAVLALALGGGFLWAFMGWQRTRGELAAAQARIDLRPGGEFFTLMSGPDGERVPNHGVFLEVQPERRLVTTDAFRPGWIPGDQAFMVADIRFEPTPEGDTHYLARAMHWTAEARRQHEDMGFHQGWNAAADQLEALARTL